MSNILFFQTGWSRRSEGPRRRAAVRIAVRWAVRVRRTADCLEEKITARERVRQVGHVIMHGGGGGGNGGNV